MIFTRLRWALEVWEAAQASERSGETGIPRDLPTDDPSREAWRQRLTGATFAKIGKSFGVSKNTVVRYYKDLRWALMLWNAAREAVGKDTVAIPSMTQAQAILTGVRRAS